MAPATWLIIGANRGLGLEFVKQILAHGDHVIATVRDASQASDLWALLNAAPPRACRMLLCDVSSDAQIDTFMTSLLSLRSLARIDYAVLLPSHLNYPSPILSDPAPDSTLLSAAPAASATLPSASPYTTAPSTPLTPSAPFTPSAPLTPQRTTFPTLETHLRINCTGPLILAQRLLASPLSIGTVVFASSDSASMARFRVHEDGFAAYAIGKVALNMGARHLAEELRRRLVRGEGGEVGGAREGRKGSQEREGVVLVVWPGEIRDAHHMQDDDPDMEVDGLVTLEESVDGLMKVIASKGVDDSGTFWTWEGKKYPW